MMTFLLMSLFLMSLNPLINLTHPLSLALILVLYSLMLGIYLMMINSSWFFYLLVLVFLGGVMVLIIYMSTLAANEKFSTIKNNNMIILPFIYLFSLFMSTNYYINMKNSGSYVSFSLLYEMSNVSSILFLMIYLLITMISVVKLVKFESGPMIKRH